MKRAVAALLFCLAATPVCAAETVHVARILSGDEVALTDGRTLRLAAIKAAPEAEIWLRANAEGRDARLQAVSTDRYGRLTAALYIDGRDVPVQDDLLRMGAASVYPLTGAEPYIDNLLEAEAAARAQGLGMWANAYTDAADAEKLIGHYGFVQGRVAEVAKVGSKIYINFGEDWREDFTVTIPAKYAKEFRKAGQDPMAFKNRILRVRGWITRDSGPGLTATDPRQVDISD